jgi:hypothetical protein
MLKSKVTNLHEMYGEVSKQKRALISKGNAALASMLLLISLAIHLRYLLDKLNAYF